MTTLRRQSRFGLASALLSLAPAINLFGQSVSLEWDHNQEPDLAGYRVYFGAKSGKYTDVVDVGLSNVANISGLVAGATNFFTVTAYNVAGIESDPSDEIAHATSAAKVNNPPVANEYTASVSEGGSVSILLSASDLDQDALSFAVAQAPANGTLSGTAPKLVYTPKANFSGRDSFTFTANDGKAASLPARVTIDVIAKPVLANTAPVAVSFAKDVVEDSSVAVVLTGTDVDKDPLTFSVVAQPSNGVLTGTAPNLVYRPSANFNGSDSFKYVAKDGKATSTEAVVSLRVTAVNDAPVGSAQPVTVQNTSSASIVLSGTDVDKDTLKFAITKAPAHGTLSGTAPNVTYKPASGYTGADSFTFTVSDGKLTSSPVVVPITVTGSSNRKPVATAGSRSMAEDLWGSVVLTGTDPDNDSLTFTVSTPPQNGFLSGTAPNLVYKPKANFHGTDTFQFTASDGKLTSEPATYTVTVTPVNDAPVATAATVTGFQNGTVAIKLEGTDKDDDKLTFKVVTQPKNGTLSGTAPALTYKPKSNYTGSDVLEFTVNDGTVTSAKAKITINITAPAKTTTATMLVLQGGSINTPKLEAASLQNQPEHGVAALQSSGSYSYRHLGGTELSDRFSYAVVTDGQTNEAVVDVRVLRILDLRAVGSDFELDFPVVAGNEYHVEFSDDSASWQTLTSLVAESEGIATVSDTTASQVAGRAYRVRCVTENGELITEAWAQQRVMLSKNQSATSTLEGTMVARALVEAVGEGWLTIEGNGWNPGELDARNGFASHMVKIVKSDSAASVGQWWTIQSQDGNALFLDAAGTSLNTVIAAGDVIEVSRLQTVAGIFGAASTSDALLETGEAVSLGSGPRAAGSGIVYQGGSDRAGYYVESTTGLVGPTDGSDLTLLPGQTVACTTVENVVISTVITGRVPTVSSVQ